MVPRGNWAFMLQGRRNPENSKQGKQTCLLISWVVNEGTTFQGWHSSERAPTSSAWAINQFREREREAGGYIDKVFKMVGHTRGRHDS